MSSALDLSQLYASDKQRNSFLRVPNSCRMKTSAGRMLAVNTVGLKNAPDKSPAFYVSGDPRSNEHPVLTSLHTVFHREHNRICRRLKHYRHFSTEKLYQTARAINIAQYQKIVFEEWLPAILGSKLQKYGGYQKNQNPTVSVEFSTAGFRIGHTMVSNIVARMDKFGKPIRSLNIKRIFFSRRRMRASEVNTVIRGAAMTSAEEVDEKVVDVLRNFLFDHVPGMDGFDLVAINIQRGRDHGLPPFNEFRKYFLGTAARSFSEISSNPKTIALLMQAYGDVSNVEAWVGLMAEDKDPGRAVGCTMAKFLEVEFRRLRDGDRFFYLMKNQIPSEVLRKIPTIESDIFGKNHLFNKILRRTTTIRSFLIPSRSNAFVLRL